MAKRTWAWIIGGTLLLGGAKLLGYLNLARNLEFIPKVRVHQMSFSGIKIAVDLKIINPTKQKASFTKPYVGVYLNNSLLGFQDAGTTKTEIQPQGSTETTVIIAVPYSLQLVELLQGKPQFRVKVVSFVDNQQLEVEQNLSLSGLAINTVIHENSKAGGIS
jgi:hypothetical protein